MKKVFTGALIIASLLVAAYLYQKYRIAPGIQFETLELTGLNGQPVNLKNYKDKKLFINFFATWCGSCLAEFPALDKAAEILMPDNFVFISFSFSSSLNDLQILMTSLKSVIFQIFFLIFNFLIFFGQFLR